MNQSNITNALNTAKSVIAKMIEQGIYEAKYVFALSNMISENYGLTKDQSIQVIESAMETI